MLISKNLVMFGKTGEITEFLQIQLMVECLKK